MVYPSSSAQGLELVMIANDLGLPVLFHLSGGLDIITGVKFTREYEKLSQFESRKYGKEESVPREFSPARSAQSSK